MSTADARRQRRASLELLAAEQSGALTRRQLYRAGWTRWQVAAELRGHRWQRFGRQVLITHNGPLSRRSMWWAAVLEVSPRAALAGGAALVAAGLAGVRVDEIDVAVPKSARPRRPAGIRVHETRRLRSEDVLHAGLPRVRPAPAAVLAALWADSDRQAALFLVAVVQQRLCTPEDLVQAVARVRRHRRLPLLQAVAADVADGAQALSELDFARLCRRGGLPEPSRQVVVSTRDGRCYLDVEWDAWSVVAEIDGVAHTQIDVWLADSWRRNDLVLDGRTVLRFPGLALRLDPDRVLAQTEAALRRAGWRPNASLTRRRHALPRRGRQAAA
jgi:hypothetical protein